MAFFRKDIGSTLFGCKLFKEKKSRNADAKRLKICDIFTESSFKRFFKLLITLFFPNTQKEVSENGEVGMLIPPSSII